jgi:hypothetical protein
MIFVTPQVTFKSICEVLLKLSSGNQIQDDHHIKIPGSRITPELERNLLLCIPILPQKIKSIREVFLNLSSGNQNSRWSLYPEVGSHQKSKRTFSCASPFYPKRLNQFVKLFSSYRQEIKDGRHIRILNRREICKNTIPSLSKSKMKGISLTVDEISAAKERTDAQTHGKSEGQRRPPFFHRWTSGDK